MLVNAKVAMTVTFSRVLLSDPEFNARAFAIRKLDDWANMEGAKRDDRYEPQFFELTPQTKKERDFERTGMKQYRVVARYWVKPTKTAQ